MAKNRNMSLKLTKKLSHKNALAISLSSLIVILLLSILFLYQNKQTVDLFASSAKYTELYFTQTQIVPQNIFSTNNLTLHFAIHNVEKSDMEYTYEILVSTKGLFYRLKENKILVKSNQTKIIAENVPIKKFYSKGSLIVFLVNKNQEIHLLLPNTK